MNLNKGFIRTLSGKVSGFTLIELLVVVAIIGILASITLGYLGSSKTKGNDAGVKTNLHTAANQAELFYLNHGSLYLPTGGVDVTGGVCPTVYVGVSGTNMFSYDKPMFDAIAEATKRGNGSSCYNSAGSYVVAVGLSFTANTSWCIDSLGTAKVVNSAPAGAIVSGLCIQ